MYVGVLQVPVGCTSGAGSTPTAAAQYTHPIPTHIPEQNCAATELMHTTAPQGVGEFAKNAMRAASYAAMLASVLMV